MTPQTLLYAKAGYTNARFKASLDGDTVDQTSSFDTDGYRLGAGVEQAIAERAFVKLEYRYSNYSEGEIDFEDDTLPDSGRVDLDLDRHQIVAGVGIRF